MTSSMSGVPLEIHFIDTPGELVIDEKLRIRVVKRGAGGQGQNIEVSQLDFHFKPIQWGEVLPTEDPFVGMLRIVKLVESEDVYDDPDYEVSASLKAYSPPTKLKAIRRSRMAPRRAEVELIFLTGYPGNYERYDPLNATQPLDPDRAFKLDSDGQSILVRDGRIFLQVESLSDLMTRIDCRLPSGDMVSCDLSSLIDSGAAWQSMDSLLYASYEQRLSQQQEIAPSTSYATLRAEQNLANDLTIQHQENRRVLEASEVQLEIDFLDAPGDLTPGEEIRFKVRLDEHFFEMRHLNFEFKPFPWASVEETGDSRVGRLRVHELPRTKDIYDMPEYGFEASLRARGEASMRPTRYQRLVPGTVEVELVFFRGHTNQYELFNPLTAPRKLDTEHAFRLQNERLNVVERESRVYLQCDRLADLKSKLEVTMPNGEVLQLDLASRIESGTLFQRDTPVFASPKAPRKARPDPEAEAPVGIKAAPGNENAEERALRERLRALGAFIISFQSRRGQPDSDTTEKIRSRISARVKQTRDALRQYQGPRQQEFLRLFEQAINAIPDYLRIQLNTEATYVE